MFKANPPSIQHSSIASCKWKFSCILDKANLPESQGQCWQKTLISRSAYKASAFLENCTALRKRLLLGSTKERLIQQNVTSNTLAQNVLLNNSFWGMPAPQHLSRWSGSLQWPNMFIEPELPFPLSYSLASYVWNFYRRVSIAFFTATRSSTLEHDCFYYETNSKSLLWLDSQLRTTTH